MANRRVSIYQSAKVGGVWSYFKPVFAPNNKIKPDWCHVNGHKEHHPGSDYLIKWYEGRKQRILKCKNAADAQNMPNIAVTNASLCMRFSFAQEPNAGIGAFHPGCQLPHSTAAGQQGIE